MAKGLTLLGIIGLGAGLMYVLDPEEGRRRRALLRDQLGSRSNKLVDAVEGKSKDLGNRSRGLVMETKSHLSDEPFMDDGPPAQVRPNLVEGITRSMASHGKPDGTVAEEPDRTSGPRPASIEIRHGMDVDAPIERVFAFWSKFANFPLFMSSVRDVRDLHDGRYHWTLAGPANLPIEWDTIMTTYLPNEELAWESVSGVLMEHAGNVRFHPNPDGGTHVDFTASYSLPGGALRQMLSMLFGGEPSQVLNEDLERSRAVIEESSLVTTDERTGRQVGSNGSERSGELRR